MRQAGSIVKKRNLYYIIYRTPERRQKWEGGFETKGQARVRLTEILGRIQTGTYCEPSATTFADFADSWLAGRVSIEADTGSSYGSYLNRRIKPALGPLKLKEIRCDTIQRFVAGLCRPEGQSARALSANTIKKIVSLLGTIFKGACRSNLIRFNPAEDIERPKVIKTKVQPADKADARAIFQTADMKIRVMLIIDAMTGLRRGEFLALQWRDIDWINSELLVQRVIRKSRATDGVHKYQWVPVAATKGGRSRRVGLSAAVIEIFRSLRDSLPEPPADDAFIFQRGGTFIEPDYFSESMAPPLIKKATAGRVKRFHDLRHFYASMLIENGESVKCIQDQLGHASATTSLDTYGHLMPQARQQAARRLERSIFGGKANVRNLLGHSLENTKSEPVN